MGQRVVALLGALVVAVAMVVGSIALRSKIDDKAVKARLTCSTELAAACHDLEGNGVSVTMEAAGTTADRLVALAPGADAGLDAWLTAGPWPQLVNQARQAHAAQPIFSTAPSLGSTRVAAVVEAQRAALVRTKCGATPDWACLGGLPGTAWKALGGSEALGQVKAGLADPADQAEGLGVLMAMSGAVFKGREFSVDDDALRALLRTMRVSRLQPGTDAVTTLLVSGGAELDVVFTTDADAQAVLASAANRAAATVLYPAPVTSLHAEVGLAGNTPASRKLSDLLEGGAGTKAVTKAGWTAAEAPGPADDAGVLAALRKAWQEQR